MSKFLQVKCIIESDLVQLYKLFKRGSGARFKPGFTPKDQRETIRNKSFSLPVFVFSIMWTNINMHVAGFGIPAVWNGEWPNKNYAFTFHHFTFPSMCETMRTQVFWNPPSGLNGQNLKWHLRFLPGCRVEWTCRCVLSTTAAVIKTAMQRTPGQRPVWTHRCPLWYARIQLQALHETLQPCRTCSLQLRLSPALNMTSPASRAPLPLQSKQSSSLSDRDTAEEDSDPLDDCGGFWRVQRRLQEEARVALALARPMARMQVEVERQIQLHRRSPVADLVSQWEGKTTPGICCCWWKAFFLPKTDCFLKFIYIEKFV